MNDEEAQLIAHTQGNENMHITRYKYMVVCRGKQFFISHPKKASQQQIILSTAVIQVSMYAYPGTRVAEYMYVLLQYYDAHVVRARD